MSGTFLWRGTWRQNGKPYKPPSLQPPRTDSLRLEPPMPFRLWPDKIMEDTAHTLLDDHPEWSCRDLNREVIRLFRRPLKNTAKFIEAHWSNKMEGVIDE